MWCCELQVKPFLSKKKWLLLLLSHRDLVEIIPAQNVKKSIFGKFHNNGFEIFSQNLIYFVYQTF